jgi:predicted nuclease of predicted toxin-antitoxin system
MRWLLDQGVPRSASARLNDWSEDAIHVGDIGMAAASDAAIIDQARQDGRIIVTLDADFHSLIATSGAAKPTVIRIREERAQRRLSRGISSSHRPSFPRRSRSWLSGHLFQRKSPATRTATWLTRHLATVQAD